MCAGRCSGSIDIASRTRGPPTEVRPNIDESRKDFRRWPFSLSELASHRVAGQHHRHVHALADNRDSLGSGRCRYDGAPVAASVAHMEEEPRTTGAGPASTSETRATRTETTEIRTSSDVQTSTSAKDEDRGDQGEEARGDQGEEARGDQGEEARGDERDRGDAPEGSSLGSKLGSKLGLGHHGDQADRDETDR